MATVFVSHPFSTEPEANQALVAAIARRLAHEGHVPVAPQIYLPRFVDEITERDRAMRICLGLLSLCDEVRVYGDPSAGMRVEIAEARRLGIPIVDGADHAG